MLSSSGGAPVDAGQPPRPTPRAPATRHVTAWRRPHRHLRGTRASRACGYASPHLDHSSVPLVREVLYSCTGRGRLWLAPARLCYRCAAWRGRAWCLQCGTQLRSLGALTRRGLVPRVGGPLKRPHGLPQGAADLRELLPPEAEQRNEHDQHEILWCEHVGLDETHPTHKSIPLCHTDSNDQKQKTHQEYSPFFGCT